MFPNDPEKPGNLEATPYLTIMEKEFDLTPGITKTVVKEGVGDPPTANCLCRGL
jgi:hypothetical protein